MVKRPKSPDASDDAKYLIIYQAYPLNANWEVPEDCIRFSRWIAGCVGPDPIFAIHYKPKARGMVIVEIDKTYRGSEKLLGEHRWSEFLKHPTDEEKDRVSQVFYCLYDNGRAAQKDGWKRIHVESAWFKEWSPLNDVIHSPYPETYWCPPPKEDQTNKPLCRPLPKSVLPPPPSAPVPVVGSSTWVSTRIGPSPNSPQALKGAWARGQKGAQALNTNTANKAGGKGPASATTPTTSAWSKPIIPKKAASSNPALPSPLAGPSRTPWGPSAPKSSIVTPVASTTTGLSMSPPTSAPSPINHLPAPPGLTRNPNNVRNTNANPAGSSNTTVITEQFVGISLSPSQERDLYGGFDTELDVDNMAPEELEVVVLAPWEKAPVLGPEQQLWATSTSAREEVVESLWGDEDETRKGPEPLICPTHNIACKKGICLDMARIVKAQERKEKEAAAVANKWKSKGGAGGGGGAWGKKGGNNLSNAGGNGAGIGENSIAGNVDNDGFAPVKGRGGARGAWGRNSAKNTASVSGSSNNGWGNKW